MTRIGKGTRLRTSINIKGDMANLLFSSASMLREICNAEARGIPTKRGRRSA